LRRTPSGVLQTAHACPSGSAGHRDRARVAEKQFGQSTETRVKSVTLFSQRRYPQCESHAGSVSFQTRRHADQQLSTSPKLVVVIEILGKYRQRASQRIADPHVPGVRVELQAVWI